eukprot:SAG22_NODE_513_length_9567_cov_25.867771_6_plen_86_part_00
MQLQAVQSANQPIIAGCPDRSVLLLLLPACLLVQLLSQQTLVVTRDGRADELGYAQQVRQRSSLLKAVIIAFPSVSLPFLAVPLR